MYVCDCVSAKYFFTLFANNLCGICGEWENPKGEQEQLVAMPNGEIYGISWTQKRNLISFPSLFPYVFVLIFFLCLF